jgi:hypothetical protein
MHWLDPEQMEMALSGGSTATNGKKVSLFSLYR